MLEVIPSDVNGEVHPNVESRKNGNENDKHENLSEDGTREILVPVNHLKVDTNRNANTDTNTNVHTPSVNNDETHAHVEEAQTIDSLNSLPPQPITPETYCSSDMHGNNDGDSSSANSTSQELSRGSDEGQRQDLSGPQVPNEAGNGADDEIRQGRVQTNPNSSSSSSIDNNHPSGPMASSKSAKSSDHKLESKIDMPVSIPAPIGVRGRVVSLDRKVYMANDMEDNDEHVHHHMNTVEGGGMRAGGNRGRVTSDRRGGDRHRSAYDGHESDTSSSYESDDGSYFSEHLPSPKSAARKVGGFPVLPPRRMTNGINPNMAMRQTPLVRVGSQGFQGSRVNGDSDLSLSSSSNDGNDELSQMNAGNPELSQIPLDKSYPMMRTTSAPVAGKFPRPRRGVDSDVDLSHVHTPNAAMDAPMQKPPIPSRDRAMSTNDISLHGSSSTGRVSPSNQQLLQTHNRSQSCTSSLVSSSSDDMGSSQNENRDDRRNDCNNVIDCANGVSSNIATEQQTSPRHHRRQNSYRSVESGSVGQRNGTSTTQQDTSGHIWRGRSNSQEVYDVVDSELSDGDSSQAPSPQRRHRRNHHYENGNMARSSSLSSVNNRIPFEVPITTGGSGSVGNRSKSSSSHNRYQQQQNKSPSRNSTNRPKAQHSGGLSEEQMKAWQNGMVRSESHLSSSGTSAAGGTLSSPERMQSGEDTLYLRKTSLNSSNSLQMAGLLVYSEDDTDESMRFMQMAKSSEQNNTGNASNIGVASAAGLGPVERRRSGRSFGQDLTNSDIAMSSKNPHGNTSNDIPPPCNTDASYVSYTTRSRTGSLSLPRGDGGEYRVVSGEYKVYWQRWLMLMYMSILNLLSDWTCYSVAPIAVLTAEAYGNINPEQLVTIFLASNAVATALEPIILSRLGLRRTVVFGSFLLMCGSVIKSGGIPGIIGTSLTAEEAQWRINAGFCLVGLSQPLYQCTPAILSCSWFPEKERTFATGVALNSNQLGIGCAFIFGTLLVLSSDDIPKYFGLLSILSTMAFIGCFIQFRDAPDTPPSGTARVMRGSLVVRVPYMNTIRQVIPTAFPNLSRESVPTHRKRLSGGSSNSVSASSINKSETERRPSRPSRTHRRKRSSDRKRGSPTAAFKTQSRRMTRKSSRDSSHRSRKDRNNRGKTSEYRTANEENGFRSSRNSLPSPGGCSDKTSDVRKQIEAMEQEAQSMEAAAPSPMMNGRVGQPGRHHDGSGYYDTPQREQDHQNWQNYPYNHRHGTPQDQIAGHYTSRGEQYPDTPFANLHRYPTPAHNAYPPQPHSASYIPFDQPIYPQNIDPRYYYHNPHPSYGSFPTHDQYHYNHQPYMVPPPPSMYYPPPPQQYMTMRPRPSMHLPPPEDALDDGAEPVLSQAGNSIDIEIRDDQILRSIRACFSRPGFVHSVIAFAASGIVLNTLSTYMDYLVRLGGSGREVVGIIGGSFQVLVMVSSIIIGKFTDKTRAYRFITLSLLFFGAFALAECNINLDAERGVGMKWSLLISALLIGPLQPVSTELAVEVAYPLCSNTVLVTQQLCSNLLSALFIPFFQRMRDFDQGVDGFERPEYTFSFYMLIVIHAFATVFFATFNGTLKRYEHEQITNGGKGHHASESHMTSQQKYEAAYHDEEQAALLK